MSKPAKGTELYYLHLMRKAQKAITKKQVKKVLKNLSKHNKILMSEENND